MNMVWRVVGLQTVLLAGIAAVAQSPSDQDKKFVHDLAQNSNFEIKSGQLALQKSQSADVKEYAQMVVRDHTALNRQIATATTTTKTDPVSPGSLSLSDNATYAKLKLLSGKSFDESYIKGLISGNEDIEKMEKSEASDSTVPMVKKLATRSMELDQKHAEKAKALAAAHGVNGKS